MKFTKKQIDRYSRQIVLKKIGMIGQKRLLKSSVLIVGAGGLGAPIAIYPSSSDIMSKTKPDANYKDRLPNGNYIERTASHFVIILGDSPSTALISMKSTQLKISRKWNSMMNGLKLKGKNGLYTPASFSHIYKLKTTQMSNDKGTWFGWEVSKVGPVTDSQAYQQAKIFCENISKGSVKAKHGDDKPKGSVSHF